MTSMEALRAAVAAVAQDAGVRVPGSQAAEEAVELGDLITRLEGARLARLQVVQEEGAWALDGSRSATAWLARHSRSSRAVAGAQLKTARMLKALPITAAAVLAGSVPAEHAKAITRTCLRTPAMADQLAHPARGEAFLLDQAHLELDEYKKLLNSWAMRADPEAVDASYREDRDDYWLQVARTSDGVAIRGFLDPVCGESLITALDARAGARSATDTRDRPARLHDALAAILARVLDGGSLGVHNTVRPQVVVHVPWVTLKAEAGTAGLPPAWLQESGAPIPRRVLDRIACDSELTPVVFGPRGEVLDLGRSTRLFTKNQRRALDARDGECRWPGCHAPPEQTEAHHRIWWSRGGLTDLRDGLLACLYHHIYIHDHDVRIEHGTDGGLEFYVHNGPLIGVSYPRGGPDADPLPWPDAA